MAKKLTTGKPRTSALKVTNPRRTDSSPSVPARIVAHSNKYAIGDRVSHPMFGDGTVTAIDVNNLTIEFRNKMTKLILADFVRPRRP